MKVVTQDGPIINGVAGSSAKEVGPTSRERAISKFMEASKNSTQRIAASGESTMTNNAVELEPQALADSINNSTEAVDNSRHLDQSVSTEESQAPVTNEVIASSQEAEPVEPISNQYAMLARKEKALRAKAQATDAKLKAEREAFEIEKRAYQAKEQEYQTKYVPKDRLKSDLPSLLAEMGLSSEEISNVIYNAPKPEEVALNGKLSSFEKQIKELTEKLENQSKSYEEKEKQSYDQALNQIHYDTKRLVASDASFELIKETGSTQLVVDRIKEKFDTEGELLDIYEASMQIENELLEKYLKTSKLRKIQEKLGVKQEAPKLQAAAQAQSKAQPMKTLTNAVASSKKLSGRERAIKRFNGEQF